MRSSDWAWLALGFGVGVYDILAGEGEMLSHAARRYGRRRPVLTRVVIAVTAAHLAGAIPASLDPFWRVGRAGQLLRAAVTT